MRTPAVAGVMLVLCLAWGPARADGPAPTDAGSRLALPALGDGAAPRLLLAQRAIDRTWGPSDDSLYTEVRVPEWRSEALAMSASAILPGAGHLYTGEASGYLYLAAEVAGWVSRTVLRRDARDKRDEAVVFAGPPGLAASGWSAERWAQATGGDPAEMQALYTVDRGAFLRLIGTDDRFLAGWSGEPAATRATFEGLRERSQTLYRRARWAETGLWLNHVVSAVDALRAARLHNLPLRRNLEIQLRGSWRRGAPSLMATVERRF
jgi:hypothetical protein